MKAGRYINGWVITSIILVAVVLAGGLIIWTKYNPGQAIEITLEPERNLSGYILVDGEINNPGLYPLDKKYSIEDLLRMAGGVNGNADLDSMALHIPSLAEILSPQKIDINRAEAWLLEALPGIGETKARAIIEYRLQNGFFRSTSELVDVEGIGVSLYEDIKHLVTVAD